MRSTTLFVWVAVALAICAGMFPSSNAYAQFQFDGDSIRCIYDPLDPTPNVIDGIGDSLEIYALLAGPRDYADAVVVTFNPTSGLGVIPAVPQAFRCPSGQFTGYPMNLTIQLGVGMGGNPQPDSMRIAAVFRFRPEGICATAPIPVTFQLAARAIDTTPANDDTICGLRNVASAIPCSTCTRCGYIRYEELCGFFGDGITAIGDLMWLDSTNSMALDPNTGGTVNDTVIADFSVATCIDLDSLTIIGDTVTVSECVLENGVGCDVRRIGVAYWSGGTDWATVLGDPANELDSIVWRIGDCTRPVDNQSPELAFDEGNGPIDSFRVINGNAIANDTLVGCCDTLRIYMATDSSYLAAQYPFGGPVEGSAYTDACGVDRETNFDLVHIAIWFGDFVGEGSDTSDYIHNSIEMGLLCPQDTLLWISAWAGIGANPGGANNLLWIDIPFCPEDWADIQACVLEKLADGDTMFVWGLDDAGNRSNFIPFTGDVCFDNVPPVAELGSDIYHSEDYCTKRFSPYEADPVQNYFITLSPDSVVWYKGRVDTQYTDIFNDVYYIGFDTRVMPEDTAALVKLNWLHPVAPLPMDPSLDTLRWTWTDAPDDSFRTACFAWYGKQGTDSIDPVLSASSGFWKCDVGGGLTVGFTFARWLDAAGCNKILGSDYDGMTDIDDNYTTRNQLRSIVDLCPPTMVTPDDTLKCTNLVLGSGPAHGPAPTYLWMGPNGGANPDPLLRFRARRNFSSNPFDPCLTEDTLFYRVRVDTVSIYGAWPADSVRWYSEADSVDGVGSPFTLWSPITFNAGDINGPVVDFHWGHKYSAAPSAYLPDGLYKLTLEVKDEAGNVYRDPIYIWLNGTGPAVLADSITNMDTLCTTNFYVGLTQDSIGVYLVTDTTADAVMVDWTCVFNMTAHPALDTLWLDLVGTTATEKRWFGYLIATPDMISPIASENIYQIAPYDADCVDDITTNRIINIKALDYVPTDTLYTEVQTGGCDLAILGISPCPRLIPLTQYFYFQDPDLTQDLPFGYGFGEWGAISPGKIDSMGGAGGYNSITNWANDQIQDSIFVRLLLDSASVAADTTDTLVVQFINPNVYPGDLAPRIRTVRKALFQPTSNTLAPDPLIHNTIFHGMIEKDDVFSSLIEFRYFWNGTWYIGPGLDSIMLVPYDQQDTILVRAWTIKGDSLINDSTYLTCDTVMFYLDVDNRNPDFRSGWTGVAVGRDPNTGTTPTVQNLGFGNDCGFRFSDNDRFRLRVLMTEAVHYDPLAYPNELGSHHDGFGYWPTPADEFRGAWQISPIDLRTGDLVVLGGDTIKVVLDSVFVDSLTAPTDSAYYILAGHFDLPNALPPFVLDSVCLVIRSAWDAAGNPGRYNNPIFTDGLSNDSAEDTTFCVVLVGGDPWAAGCPLVWGVSDSVLGWIAAEEDSVIVRATIIETSEITECSPGVKADSARVVEGNFQMITDTPSPWVLFNSRGPWFLYIDDAGDTLGWAREYTWILRADSADLATIHCDGTYLRFALHYVSYNGQNSYRTFNNCVRVDVNEPLWASSSTVLDTSGVAITACLPAFEPFWIAKSFSDDGIDCPGGDGVGVIRTVGSITADLSNLLANPGLTNVPPDSLNPAADVAYWYIAAVPAHLQCVDSAMAWVRFHALTDSLGHFDPELFDIDNFYFCSDCVPPHIAAVNVFCDCDEGQAFATSPDSCMQLPTSYVGPGKPFNIVACFADVNGDSSSGIDMSSVVADLSLIDPAFVGWYAPDFISGSDTLVKALWGWDCLEGTELNLNAVYNNGAPIKVIFQYADNDGNSRTDTLTVALADSLPPIVNFIYTIGDDSIRAYVTPGDQHVHIYANISGYAADLLSAPENVYADLRNFHCGPDSAAYAMVPASYIEPIDANNYRAWWGWYPGPWVADHSLYPTPFDTTSLESDTLKTGLDLCSCAFEGAEGWYDTLWVYVSDGACNVGSHYNVFEISGCDTTTPAVDSVWVIGNDCHLGSGWISSTPLDSGHVEVWAWMDTVFTSIADTVNIDSVQANLSLLSPLYAWTAWGAGHTGGAPVYGDTPDLAQAVPTYWDIEIDGAARPRLVAKWINLAASNKACLDTIKVPVKSIRATGSGGSHGYYMDVEYGTAQVDTTRPVIYDMRVYSATTSINETTWVSPNVPLYVDVWAYDTNCDTVTDHLGFDLMDPDGPFIRFCNPEAGFDTIWTWSVYSPSVMHSNADSLDRAWIMLRWIGTPNYNDTCNAIDLDNLTGCIEANLEDCLSNPAVPVQRNVITDDRPPQFVNAVPWGDFTHVTGFPGDPDHDGIDSVLVLQNSVYALDWDSVLVVNVVVDNTPGDTLISWAGTFINFAGFLTTPLQYPDQVFYNIDGNHRDSLVWLIPLYDGSGPLFNTSIPSNRYWYSLVLADTMTNNTGDPWDEQPDPSPTTLFCDDLDSVITFTIQNWNSPNPGMILLCDSNTVAGSDSDFVDANNMALWNNEFVSPDAVMENLYKIYYAPGQWAWYSHEDQNGTRFFIFVEDTVLQADGIDNDGDNPALSSDGIDNDGDGFTDEGDEGIDEIGEGVDFYTADLRINGIPQVGHVDSMNVAGVFINYLWFADNFDQQRYDVSLFISDIYGHRDTLACGDFALQFFEDESCPVAHDLTFWQNGESRQIRVNGNFVGSFDLADITADDSLFVFMNFDSVSIIVRDPMFLIAGQPGSGPDLDTTTVDSVNYNNGMASMIELLGPDMNPVLGFGPRYMDDTSIFDEGPLSMKDPTGVALAALADGWYTIRVTMLDRVGNSCVRTWSFRLDRSCPTINTAFATRPGQNTPVGDLYTSWDYVELTAQIEDELDGVDSVYFEYAFDANRDGNVDAYSYWQRINILSDEGANWDTDYPFTVYWNIRNLPWSSEDTLGLPPVRPDSCVNTYFVRVRALDIYGHECRDTFAVNITDDIAPLAYIERIGRPGWGWDFTPQGAVVPCYNPNTGLADSLIYVYANDLVAGGYDPLPGDTFTVADRWFDLAKGVFQYKRFDAPNLHTGDPYTGWTNMWTPGQDTATYRNWLNERFIIQWNLIHPLDRNPLNSGQYNIRFVAIDVCDNSDPLNTPVITVRIECDTTAPIAVICAPDLNARVTNYRCNADSLDANAAWVLVKSTSAIHADLDSVAFFFVDSLSIPGLGVHTFIGGDANPLPAPAGFATEAFTRWNTNNLISGWYWLYAVAYDNDANFDTNPIWHRVYVDNTMPTVELCSPSVETTWEDSVFTLRAWPSDPDGGTISAVWFQYLNRQGNWVNLPSDTTVSDVNGLYGADLTVYDNNPMTVASSDGSYRVSLVLRDFDQSPLDSIRFRALAVDQLDRGDNNLQGDRNRDCNVDRDLVCGRDVCCMAVLIRDRIPFGTNLWAFNHGQFRWSLPVFDDPTTAIMDGDRFSTCNDQNPLDTLLLVANVHDSVTDGWLMHFKFWRSWPEGFETTPAYVPNNTTLNPTIPALGPITLFNTWDSVYVIWTDVRAFIEAADAADGLTYSQWTFASYVEDLSGNIEPLADQNMTDLVFACTPQAPITHASYVRNDVENPNNRIRVTDFIPYTDSELDVIEVIYNRTTGPGINDPEALVLFYTDADAIRNCRDQVITPFNVQLWLLNEDQTLGRLCPSFVQYPFAFLDNGFGYDQYPPDNNMDNRYVVGLYLDNTFGPGVYNFAMIVRSDEVDFPSNPNQLFYDGDSNNDGFLSESDSTRIDLVVRVVNVNEPQITLCYPEYGATCVHGTVPMSASLVDNPEFTGVVDTVWFEYFDGSDWLPIIDPVTGLSYDTDPTSATIRMEFNENEVPGMAGWYYDMAGDNVDNPLYSWYAERDMFPDVWVWVLGGGTPVPMTRDANGLWTADISYPYNVGQCTNYAFVIDANDNNILEGPSVDRWVADPREACAFGTLEIGEFGEVPVSELCACDYLINFPSRDFENTSYNFRTVVGWHDAVAYHVIENPSLGDSIHVFFVDNEPADATHDIEFDRTRLAGGMLNPSNNVCTPADTVWFVTDIQPLGSHGLVVEDICKVIYQVSLTSNPAADNSWVNIGTVFSDDDMGWTEAWPMFWVAINPLTDNIDNDGDGLVDETRNVQGGNRIGEENVRLWSRSVVVDYCGNTYYAAAESLWVDVSAPEACVTQVGDVAPANNQVVIIPSSRDLTIVATDQSYADPGIIAVFQYRNLNPIGAWTNIQADTLSNDTVRHVGNTFTAVWDLLAYFQQTGRDPEGWYQLRAIAIDTVGNSDLCDNVVCQITIRLNDIEPAARVEVYQIYSINDPTNVAMSCTDPNILYIQPNDPYCMQAIFAPTNIDTGLASLTFQYQTLTVGGNPSAWRNIETIYDPINYGLNGDTTRCVIFQPRPQEIGEHGFNLRVIVEDYNGNDTSAVVTLYADGTPPVGTGAASPSIAFTGPCGDRCRLDNDGAMITALFNPDPISGEVNVANAWITIVRDDGLYPHFMQMYRGGPDTWEYDFDGDLCAYWLNNDLDMGCYYFTLHYVDCAGNEDSVAVTTTCREGDAVTLICIDCLPARPDLALLDNLTYSGFDCADEEGGRITDNVLDGTTEIGNQTVEICGHIPSYQQYIGSVRLFVESTGAGVGSTLVDTYEWVDTRTSAFDTTYCFDWDLTSFPSGRYRVWVEAIDAICQNQNPLVVDEFWVYVDNTAPLATITGINGQVPNPTGPDAFEVFSGTDDPGFFWVDWTDGLTPDDSTQAHNRVQLWAKTHSHPNQADAWRMVGEIPSPCNPHFVIWYGEFACGDTMDIVATMVDRWDNGSLGVDAALAAFDAGRFVDIYITDSTPPSTELWSVGLTPYPGSDDNTMPVDQQNNIVHLASNFWDQDVYLHAFSAQGDPSIERVYFQYSVDGTTWFDIAVDDNPESSPSCVGFSTPPWWCDASGQIFWSALWDISGLRGRYWVRTWGQDVCGNVEDYNLTEVTIDVEAPMARVFAWMSNVNVDNLPCNQWTEPQIPDSLSRFSTLTLGACPDSVGTPNYDAYGTMWYLKRATDNPLESGAWCFLGDDSTGPFSLHPVNLWDGTCIAPVPGVWYDIAVRTTDQNGHTVPWEQFMFYGQGTTWQEKWQDLINRGYVKRFRVVDHTAPVAYSLMVDPDCTPDSSVIFVHGNVMLSAHCDALDVTAVTFAALEVGATGPWTVIERVEGTAGHFSPVEGLWNTELLNGTYWIGAFAEDGFGNMDGNLLGGLTGAPTNRLMVYVDNQAPTAAITSVWRTNDPTRTPVTVLERGAEVTVNITATDNFTVRKVRFYYRHTGGDPDAWTQVGGDRNWPFSFNWTVPTDLVVGWSYDFAAVAVDYCEQTDRIDGQGNYIIDWTAQVVDNEANIAIVTIGGADAETTPRIHGTAIEIVAHSEPTLDHVRFIWVRGADTTIIRTIAGTIGQTVWTMPDWDVTTISEGPAQLCAIGSADLGGGLVTLATDCRNIVIDHSLPYVLTTSAPAPRGLLGGLCEFDSLPVVDDLFVRFNPALTDAGIDTVWFEWKRASDPNDEQYWNGIAMATQDNGLTGRWAYAWDATSMDCGTITLRARVSDNAVPVSNEVRIIFADTVRVDNCAPLVNITNINGDITPEDVEIARGATAVIVATVIDPFANGGNSAIDSVAFYYSAGGGELTYDWIYIGSDANGAPWQTSWNTSSEWYGTYTVRAIAWDDAGNCADDLNAIQIVDRLTHRAYIVGWDADNEQGCDDNLYALTDDCTPDLTNRVLFEYSVNGGQSWISLGTDNTGNDAGCWEGTYYQMWSIELEFSTVPQNAIFRAVAIDAANNFDPKPPRFQFSDVATSPTPVIYNPQAVRVPAHPSRRMPWVFSMLEDFTENCQTNTALVCVRPSEPDSAYWVGRMPDETAPCNAYDDRDSRTTIFRGMPVTRIQGGDTLTYMTFTNYNLAIHQVSFEDGSNGWLRSESGVMDIYVPMNASSTDGILWFEPVHETDFVNLIPVEQYYYTMLSDVEVIVSQGLTSPTYEDDTPNEIRIRMRFNPADLPQGYEPWQVVPAYWDNGYDLWMERGVVHVDRDSVHLGIIDFEYSVADEDWDPSDWYTALHSCYQIRFAVFLSTVRPIDEFVRFASEHCSNVPDSTYYTPTRGVTTNCDPVMWAVLRHGEEVPDLNTIDVYLDGIRIVSNGVPDGDNGQYEGGDIFVVSYDAISGVFTVRFNANAGDAPPWFGCLSHGPHTIQIYSDNMYTRLTPFFVDNTAPSAFTSPEYLNHQITLWANLTDAESGIDTTSVQVVISDCGNEAYELVYDEYWEEWYFLPVPMRSFVVNADAMTFVRIPGGYRASFQVQWAQVSEIMADDANFICVTWGVENRVCQTNVRYDQTSYIYTIDVEPPIVISVSPVGAPIDDDGDGLFNEDWRDCLNNDNDFWWDSEWGIFRDRIDEDPINYLPDTLLFGERPTIEASVNDLAMCGSGASGVNINSIWLVIDGFQYGIADTGRAGLNFHILWPNQRDDAYILFGGPQVSQLIFERHYGPGEHRVSVAVADSAGNLAPDPFSWTYYVRAPGPSITFGEPGACGLWFNPEVTNTFSFSVDGTAGMPIAINGVRYSVYAVPSGERISGPVVVPVPTPQEHVDVNYVLQGSLPAGQTGIEIVVDAWNLFGDPESADPNGVTHSRMTFWADNFDPVLSNYTPADSAIVSIEDPLVIEVFYNDDSPGSANSLTTKGELRVSKLDASGKRTVVSKSAIDLPVSRDGRRGGDGLDDNGSGINVASFRMTIVPPNGAPMLLGPEHMLEIDAAHAKYVIGEPPAGNWRVNVRIEDCVGNTAAATWSFRVLGGAPLIGFLPVEGECRYQNFWNPDYALPLHVSIREMDGINVRAENIRVDIQRVFECETGLCTETLMSGAEYTFVGETPDRNNTAQVFVIRGNYNFTHVVASEIRILVTAVSDQGVQVVRTQSWVVDETAPWTTIVSPVPDTTVPQNRPVTIGVNFGDNTDGSAIILPGGDIGKDTPVMMTGKNGSVEQGVFGSKASATNNKFALGDWSEAVTSSLDDLDASSGVDQTCIELLLMPHNGSGAVNLTDAAVITANNIRWTGSLDADDYTAILSICDRVCNTSSISWTFTVGRVDTIPPVIELLRPSPADTIAAGSTPTFDVKFTEVGNTDLSRESIRVRLETANSVLVTSELSVTFDGITRTAIARLTPTEGLTSGQYILYAEGADIMGNAAYANWTFVVYTEPQPEPGEIIETESAFNYPNPFEFGGETRFRIPVTGTLGVSVQIKVYDFAGQFVANVYDGPYAGGDPIWNGRNENGETIANGVYLAHVITSAGGKTREDIVKVAFKNKK